MTIGRALDSNNDLIFEEGSIKIVSGAAQVVQQVRSRLLFYLGEWSLDLTAGTPYFQSIFIKPVNLSNIELIIKNRILNTEGIDRLVEFSMNYEGESSRLLTIFFSAETTFGMINNEEVTINVRNRGN